MQSWKTNWHRHNKIMTHEAYVGLEQYELAKQDLLKLLELSPNDSENIKKLLQSLNKKKKTNLWSRLFGKK